MLFDCVQPCIAVSFFCMALYRINLNETSSTETEIRQVIFMMRLSSLMSTQLLIIFIFFLMHGVTCKNVMLQKISFLTR